MHSLCHSRATPAPPIDIYGPCGISKFINDCYEDSHSDIDMNSNFQIHELRTKYQKPNYNNKLIDIIYPNENGVWSVFKDDLYDVKAAEIKHKVFTLGYSIKEKQSVGHILIDNVKSMIEENKDGLKKLGYDNPYKVLSLLQVYIYFINRKVKK